MKLIIINDSDGHTWAVEDTEPNRKKIIKHAQDAGILFKDENELPTGRTRGGVCELVDTDSLDDTRLNRNPFE